jgi:hypothetical protein
VEAWTCSAERRLAAATIKQYRKQISNSLFYSTEAKTMSFRSTLGFVLQAMIHIAQPVIGEVDSRVSCSNRFCDLLLEIMIPSLPTLSSEVKCSDYSVVLSRIADR